MNSFHLEVYAADHPLYCGECESLEFPTTDGQYGIQAHHREMVAAVVPGLMKFRLADKRYIVASVSEGLIKVEDNDVLVLVNTAEKPEDIDTNRAQREAEQAMEELLQKRSIRDYHTAQAKIARELSRLKAKRYQNM